MNFFEKFGKSALELKTLRCLTVTGVLIALDIVLKMVSVKISADLKITFAYLALATIGMLFGPTVAFLAGAVTDIIGFMMNPDGGFSPLFTFIEAAGAMIYGIFLYDLKPFSIKKQDSPTNKYFDLKLNLLKSLLIGVITGAVFGLLMFALGSSLSTMTFEDKNVAKLAAVFTASELKFIAAAVGFLYGAFFGMIILTGRKNRDNLKQSLAIVLSKVTVVVACNLIMTPVAMVISGYTTTEAAIAGYPLRLAKNLIQCPVDCLILLIILFPILAAYKKIFPNSNGKFKNKNTESEASNG